MPFPAILFLLSLAASAAGQTALPETFLWTARGPLVLPGGPEGEDWHAVKDPSIVHHEGRWHLFVTVRGTRRSHAIQHIAFADWKEAHKAPRRTLACHPGFFCAPQVFFFRPHGRWYLVCQASDPSWDPEYQPAWSSTEDIARPESWSKLAPLFGRKPGKAPAWLDFWVIADDTRAHLFFTSLDGRMWRSETRRDDFPRGWSEPAVALEGDIFEASHTYRLRGDGRYLTVVEAQGGHGWRYMKAYLADRLDGDWKPLAAGKDGAFASLENVLQPAERWTDCVSHGELIRSSADERLEVDPGDLRLVFQGVLDRDRAGKPYGAIPWKLGILEPRGEHPHPPERP